MEDDDLLDQFSMTFDLQSSQDQDTKNEDALLDQFSMSFDLSPLALSKDTSNKRTHNTVSTQEKGENVRVQQTKVKKKRDVRNETSLFSSSFKHAIAAVKKNKEPTKANDKMGEEKERANAKNKANIKADDKETDKENANINRKEKTKQKQKIRWNHGETKDQENISNVEIKEQKGNEEHQADIKKEELSTFQDEDNNKASQQSEIAEDKIEDNKKNRKWTKGIEGVFVCNICNEDLGNRFNIRYHMKKKHDTVWKPEKIRKWKKGVEGVYICSICKEDCGNKINIKHHMKNKHDTVWKPEKIRKWKKGVEGVFICNICKEDLGNRFNIRNHMKKRHDTVWKPSKKIKKEAETGEITKMKKKKKKIKTEFQEGIHWKLDKSKKGEENTENAWVNVKTETNTKRAKKLKIKKESNKILKKERKWRKGKAGVFICTVCDKDKGSKFNLQCHMKIIHKDIWQKERDKRLKEPRWKNGVAGKYICKICEKDCGNRPNIQCHMRRKHNTIWEPEEIKRGWKKGVAGLFICQFCEKDCGNKNNLRFHTKSKHTTEWQQIKAQNISMEKKKVEDNEKRSNNVNDVPVPHIPREEKEEKSEFQDHLQSINGESRFTLQVPRSVDLQLPDVAFNRSGQRPKSPLRPLMRKKENIEQRSQNEETLNQILKKAKKSINVSPEKSPPEVVPCYACLACLAKDCVDCTWCSGKKTGRRNNKCFINKCLNPLPKDSIEPLTLMEGQPFAFGPIRRHPRKRNPSSEKVELVSTDQQSSDVKIESKLDITEEVKPGVSSLASNVQVKQDESLSLEETDLAISNIMPSETFEESNPLLNEVEIEPPNQEFDLEESHPLKADESTSQMYVPNDPSPQNGPDQHTSNESSETLAEDSGPTLEDKSNFVSENPIETEELQESINADETNEFINIEGSQIAQVSESTLIATEDTYQLQDQLIGEGDHPNTNTVEDNYSSNQSSGMEGFHASNIGDSLVKEPMTQGNYDEMENTHSGEQFLTEAANLPSDVTLNETPGTYTLCRTEDGTLYVVKS